MQNSESDKLLCVECVTFFFCREPSDFSQLVVEKTRWILSKHLFDKRYPGKAYLLWAYLALNVIDFDDTPTVIRLLRRFPTSNFGSEIAFLVRVKKSDLTTKQAELAT